METIEMTAKDRTRELRLGLKRYIAGFTYPPKQVDLAYQLKVSEGVLSNFLNRPEKPMSDLVLKRIERFLEKQNGKSLSR